MVVWVQSASVLPSYFIGLIEMPTTWLSFLCSMHRFAVRLYHPLSIRKGYYHSLPPFLGLSHRKTMDDSPQTGQTRPKPGSGSSSPIGKKPRLETPSEAITLDRIKDHLVSSAIPKKSAKKEARKAKRKGLHIPPEPYSTEDVLWRDVASVLGQDVVDKAVEDGIEWESPFQFREEVELTVHSISSNGTCFNLTIKDLSL